MFNKIEQKHIVDLSYCPETGKFTRPSGRKVGWVSTNGYLMVGKFRAHRIAYFIMTGENPENDIDHVNGDRLDNRWINLRPATRSQNLINKKHQKNNKLNLKNVSIHQGKYRVEIRRNGKRVHDKSFDCPAAAYIDAQIFQIQNAGEYAHRSF